MEETLMALDLGQPIREMNDVTLDTRTFKCGIHDRMSLNIKRVQMSYSLC